MIAPPGAGKGTQGALIAAHFGIPRIVVGDLLRDHVARRTDLGHAVQGHLDRGELVPDEIVLGMVRQALVAVKANGGEYVVDGVPRTMSQARAGYRMARELGMVANIALHLQADDEVLLRRLLARAAAEQRSDDTDEVIRRRLELYHQVTQPLLAWYAKRGILVSVDAVRPAREVGREILAALEVMRPLVEHIPERLREPVDLTGLESELNRTTAAVPTTPSPAHAGQPRGVTPVRGLRQRPRYVTAGHVPS
jgi:adenylate kinase